MSRASCGGKVQYPSFSSAAAAAKNLRRAKSAQAQAYSCQGCGRFHVGNTIGPPGLHGKMRRARLEAIREREMRA